MFQLGNGLEATGQRLLELDGKDFLKHPVERIRVQGFQIRLNPRDAYISGQIAKRRMLEPDVTPTFQRALGGAKLVVDAGANIGWYTMLSASRLQHLGRVLAFEPDGLNFSLLSNSAIDNGFDNVELFNQALSDVSGVATIYPSPDPTNPGLHSFYGGFGERGKLVRTTTLQAAVSRAEASQIDVLKLDVEGAEPVVLKGAGDLTSRERIRHIFMEWTPKAWVGEEQLVDTILTLYDVEELRWGRSTRVKNPYHLGRRANLHLKLKGGPFSQAK